MLLYYQNHNIYWGGGGAGAFGITCVSYLSPTFAKTEGGGGDSSDIRPGRRNGNLHAASYYYYFYPH
jgi:hypothetical protein